jgi:GNAT superfamily N-acetyltransferase
MATSPFSPIEIRRLWPADAREFREHLLRLEAKSRHDRFGGAVSDDFIGHYAEGCFGRRDLVYGAFVDNCLRGAGELRSAAAIWTEQAPFARHIAAEAAFSVEEHRRRRGLGARLFARIGRAATNHGVETIEIFCTPNNIGMMRLAAKFATKFTLEENQLTGRLTARRPTAFSLWREATCDVSDYASALFDSQMRAVASAGQKDS